MGEARNALKSGENYSGGVERGRKRRAEERSALGIVLVCGEEIVVEGAEARELEKRSTPVMVEARGRVGVRVVEREAREERAERWVTVDEGG